VEGTGVEGTGCGAGASAAFFTAVDALVGVFFAAVVVSVAARFVPARLAVVFLVAGEPGDSVCAFDIELTPVNS
jgi:hypothetical protein